VSLYRWWARCGYAWRNDPTPLVTSAHRWVDLLTTVRPALTESRGTGGALTFAYAGLRDGLTQILPFLEQRREPHDGPTSVRRRRPTSWRELARAADASGADITAVGCLDQQARRLPRARSLVLPMRLSLAVPVQAEIDEVCRRVSRKDRQQYARERERRSWTVEVGTGADDFAHFYRRMHQPTMRRRHGEATRSESARTAYECLFRHGVLLFLCESGRPVAGMLCRLEPARRTLVIRLAGVLDGADVHYRSGTHMAMYLGVLEWAAINGIESVNLSGCEPFLSKGILQFKRKLHPVVELPANHFGGKRMWLAVHRDSHTVRDFLVDNPPVAVDCDGLLWATYFHDRDRPARTDLRWQTPGIAGRRLVDLDTFLAGAAPPRIPAGSRTQAGSRTAAPGRAPKLPAPAGRTAR
jgi:hypothetical protein